MIQERIPSSAWRGILLVLLALMVLAPHAARADIGPAAQLVPEATKVGEGRLTFLGLRVFDAELYAPGGTYREDAPFALKLTYRRSFKGAAIAERSATEISRQGFGSAARLDSWRAQMTAVFPNVAPGQSITGVRDRNAHTLFYLDGKRIGVIRDPEFTRRFFAIWLGANSRDRTLRNQLIGKSS